MCYTETTIIRDGDVQQQAMFGLPSPQNSLAPGPSAQADPERRESSIGRTVRKIIDHILPGGKPFHRLGKAVLDLAAATH
jgi:hypothetical protein